MSLPDPTPLEKELEELKEKNHRMLLKIQNLKLHHSTEIEYLKDEFASKLLELKSHEDRMKAEWKAKEIDFTDRLGISSEENNLLRDQMNILKGKFEQSQATVDHLKSSQVDRVGRTEQVESMRIAQDQLNIELKSARHLLETHQSRIHDLSQENEKQLELIEKLKEEIESKDVCISQLQARMRVVEDEHQEDIMMMQQNIMDRNRMEEEIVDDSKRGNSLFSELEERRVRVESELTRLRSRVARLTSENVELQSQIERGDCRSAIISQQLQVINKSQNDFIQDLKKLKTESIQTFEMYRDRFDALRSEYKRKLVLYRDNIHGAQMGELEGIREERDNLLSENMAIRRELHDLKKEFRYCLQQKTEAEANIKIFRVKLQAAQEQQRKGHLQQDAIDKLKSPDRSQAGKNGEKWLYQNILTDADQSSIKESISSTITTSAKKNGEGGSSDVSKYSRPPAEEIPDCKQQ